MGTCALLLSAGVASAQEQPRTLRVPHYNRKALIAEVSLLAASKTADAITTRQLLDRSGRELNPVFGSHPSPGKQSLINLGIFGAESGALYLTEQSRHGSDGRAAFCSPMPLSSTHGLPHATLESTRVRHEFITASLSCRSRSHAMIHDDVLADLEE